MSAILAATAILAVVHGRLAIRDLLQAQEQHHVALTRFTANIVWPRFSAFKSKNAGVLSARAGIPASELVHRNQFPAFEQTVGNADVVSSYIPLRRAGTGEVEAAFEIYREISPLLERLRETRKAIAHARCYGEHLAILFLDLDGFKRINDMRGHAVGDALLKAVADRMRESMRESDTIGRYLMQTEDHFARFSGDEFMILLTRLQRPGDVALAARRLLDALAPPYRMPRMPDSAPETITAGIGMAIFPHEFRS